MQNHIQKFRQSSIPFKKPNILYEISKTLVSSNYPRAQYFLLKLCLQMLNVCAEKCLQKGIRDFVIWFRS